MSRLQVQLMGYFGNKVVQYLFARAYAEKYGCVLETGPWLGRELFQIEDPPMGSSLPRVDDFSLEHGRTDIMLTGYSQHPKCMIYSREQARNWLQWRPEVEERLREFRPAAEDVLAHRRVGDYPGCGYPVLSALSYLNACEKFGLPAERLIWVTEESPSVHGFYDDRCYRSRSCAPDFYRLAKSQTLLRGNSTFSWAAAAIGNSNVFSPVIDVCEGEGEHLVEFVSGNHPRLATLPVTLEMRLLDDISNPT